MTLPFSYVILLKNSVEIIYRLYTVTKTSPLNKSLCVKMLSICEHRSVWKYAKLKRAKKIKCVFWASLIEKLWLFKLALGCCLSFCIIFRGEGKEDRRESSLLSKWIVPPTTLMLEEDSFQALEKCANTVIATWTKATLHSSAHPLIWKLQISSSFSKSGFPDSNPWVPLVYTTLSS